MKRTTLMTNPCGTSLMSRRTMKRISSHYVTEDWFLAPTPTTKRMRKTMMDLLTMEGKRKEGFFHPKTCFVIVNYVVYWMLNM